MSGRAMTRIVLLFVCGLLCGIQPAMGNDALYFKSVAISANGKRLITTMLWSIHFWNTDTGKIIEGFY